MLLMTIRHKSIKFFTWLICFLTFYLGFNHQVMCYELLPQGGIHKIHLQFIECNPLASSAIPAKHSPDRNMPVNLSARQATNDCPTCRDFHISFKKTPGFNSSSIGPIVSYLSAHPLLITNGFLTNLKFRGTKHPLDTQTRFTLFSPSLASLKTIILLI